MDKTPSDWTVIQDELEGLRASLSQLRDDYPDDGDFLVAFAGIADQIRWRARHDENFIHHVGIALTDMLVEAGVVPEQHRQH